MKVFFGQLFKLVGGLIAIASGLCGLACIPVTGGASILISAIPVALGMGLFRLGNRLLKSDEMLPPDKWLPPKNPTRQDTKVYPRSSDVDQE